MTPSRFLLLLAAALLAGCSKPPAAPDATPPAPVVWESPGLLAPEEWTELVGATQPLPDHVGRVAAPIDGRVDSLLVVKDDQGKVVKELHEGDDVEANDPIARLDDRIARLNRDKSKSAVDAAWQDVAQGLTALSLALDQLTSLQTLQKNSPALVPDIQMRTAQGAVRDARSKLLAAYHRHDQAKEDQQSLEAQLQFYTLKAPIKGRLGRIQATIGQTLTAGTELAEIVNVEDQIDVLCFVSPSEAARLKVGLGAGLGGLDEKADEVRSPDGWGQVVYLSDKAEPETGCFAVKVRFPNQDPHLRANVVQRVRVQVRADGEQLSIPEAALIEDREPPSVVIVEEVKTQKDDEGKDEQVGTARRMQPLISVRDRENKIVGLRGLVDSDGKEYKGPLKDVRFVTKGAQGLETGDAVRLQEKEK